MPLLVRNDQQIQVGITPGLVSGSTSFTFDGTFGKEDYRGYEIVISEYSGRSPMIKGVDYSWDYMTGLFNLLLSGDSLQYLQYYNVHFQNAIPGSSPASPSSLIDYSYFIRNITIPNIDPAKPTNAVTLDRLISFIQKYEPECLRNILGYALYKAMVIETSQRVSDLIYGADYIDYQNVSRRWRGLIQPNEKISLIANYIYYFYQEAAATQTSGVNTNIPKGEASVAVSPADKMLNAWQFFHEETSELIYFLWNQNRPYSLAVYPEFTEQQRYYTQNFSRINASPF